MGDATAWISLNMSEKATSNQVLLRIRDTLAGSRVFFKRAGRRLTCSANEQFPLRDEGRTMTHHDVSHFCEQAPITYQYCMSYANMHYAARHITHKKPCFRSLACWRVCRTSLWMNEWPWKRKKQRNDTPMLLGAFLVLRRDVRWKRRLDQ